MKPYLYCLLILTLSALATGCGASKTAKSDGASSRGPNSNIDTSRYKLGECNRVNLSQVGITGQIGTYYEPATQAFRSDYINFNIKTIPSDIYTNTNLQFQIFRWSEETAGQKKLNSLPVRFYFIDKLNGKTTASTPVDRISKATIEAARNSFKSSWVNVSTQQFFDRVMIVLTGIDMQYDALRIAKYDTSISTSALSHGDVLLPAFFSNPRIYKETHPVPNLYNLHPNIYLISSNSSENDYFQLIEEICADLSGVGGRIPASVTNPVNNDSPIHIESQPSLFKRAWQFITDTFSSALN